MSKIRFTPIAVPADAPSGKVELFVDESDGLPKAINDAGDVTTLGVDYVPENVANKSTNTSLGTSDTLYPSQKAVKTYVDAALSGISSGFFSETFTPGVDGNAGDALAVGDGATGSTTPPSYNSYDGNHMGLSYKAAFKIAVPSAGVVKLTAITANIFNTGGGGSYAELRATIFADVAGVPGGSSLGSKQRPGQFVSGNSQAQIVITFDTAIAVSPSTTYWAVIEDTSTNQGFNKVLQLASSNSNGDKESTDSGGSYSAVGHDFCCGYSYQSSIAGYVYKASAALLNFGYKNFIGFALTNYTAGTPVSVLLAGMSSLFSGLTPGSTYYLQDSGGAIGTSAGTNSLKIGRAVTATKLNVIPSNI